MRAKRAMLAGLALLGTCTLALVGCSSSGSGGSTPGSSSGTASGKLTKLVVVQGQTTTDVTNAHLYVGVALGYYQQAGFDVSFQGSPQSSSGALQLLSSGGADVAYPTVDGYFGSVAGGMKDLTAVYQAARGFVYRLAVKPGSAITSVSDLAGKTIGVNSLSAGSEAGSNAILRSGGVDPKSVKYLAVGHGGAAAGKALQNGTIDALGLTDTADAQIETLGFKMTYLSVPDAPTVGASVLVRTDYLQKNKDAVVKLLRAMAESQLFAVTNPDAAVRIFEKMFPQQSLGYAGDMTLWNARKDRYQPDSQGTFGSFDLASLTKVATSEGVTDQSIDWSQYFTNDLIAQANDFDHNAIIAQAKAWKP